MFESFTSVYEHRLRVKALNVQLHLNEFKELGTFEQTSRYFTRIIILMEFLNSTSNLLHYPNLVIDRVFHFTSHFHPKVGMFIFLLSTNVSSLSNHSWIVLEIPVLRICVPKIRYR